MINRKYIGPTIGIIVFFLCSWILFRKFQTMDIHLIINNLKNISCKHWLLAIVGALIAYVSLAIYDDIGLKYLGKRVNKLFIFFTSFSTYALSHNIGASVFSGAAIRYRAYKTKGLTLPEIATLVVFCAFTFILGILSLTSFILIFKPSIFQRFYPNISTNFLISVGAIIALAIVCYILGSLMNFKKLQLGSLLSLEYPKFSLILKQLLIAPIEILGATLIIYMAMPPEFAPSFLVILGIFVVSFSATLLSNAPAGGLGVLEVVFIFGLPEVPEEVIISSLLIFRLLYLLIPLFISLILVAAFELQQLKQQSKLHRNRLD